MMKFREIIQERKKLLHRIDQLEELAFRDQLTSLPNRYALLDDLAKVVKTRTTKKSTQVLGLLILDIDWFKAINDQFGHLTGDKVLRRAAEIIDRSIQESVLRQGDRVYRIGGEEFLVLLPAISKEGIGILAERIRKNIADQLIKEFPSVHKKRSQITISIGGKTYARSVVQTNKGNLNALLGKLMLKPDEYLYQAKALGRNCIVINGQAAV